jgi:hypothetical protein
MANVTIVVVIAILRVLSLATAVESGQPMAALDDAHEKTQARPKPTISLTPPGASSRRFRNGFSSGKTT